MDTPIIWFAAITILWTGYFVLEGFDFGVGALAGRLSRSDDERSRLLSTILPIWDGNEVWLITAIGAMFAAFPAWYAGLLSGFYPLFLVALLALIVRAIGLEYRAKRPESHWRRACDLAITAGSIAAPLTWGLILTAMFHGVPLNTDGHVTAGLADLVHPFTIAGAVTVALLFIGHGAAFLTLKTSGHLRDRAHTAARAILPVTAASATAFVVWTYLTRHTTLSTIFSIVMVAALALAPLALWRHRDGWAFAATTTGTAAFTATLFTATYPMAIPSITADVGLTLADAAASPYTLGIMSIAALIFLPLIGAYQAWTYWVFRKRVLSPPS
ncbi:cytochrome d ubiquinol oxidase subunit II [Stackebrandtia soli]|uniref:cytochrome d ubiquinol oxidase subunit II n=1 Tax=Stackebrandtia soli TaxID=1892856 RepID=UPI0039EC7461